MDTDTVSSLTAAERPKLLLADDHRIVGEGIAQLLLSEYDVVALVGNGEELVRIALEQKTDVIVTDISMPGLNGVDALRQIKAVKPDVPMILLTMHEEPAMVQNALDAGVRGYVLKNAAGEDLLRAVKEVLNGRRYVSPTLLPSVIGKSRMPAITARQRTVLNLMAAGLRSREIAAELKLSVRTVEAHRQAMMEAFQVRNGIELVREAARYGIVDAR